MMRSDAVRGFIASAIERQKSQTEQQPAPQPDETSQPVSAAPSSVQTAAQNFANIFQQKLGNRLAGLGQQQISVDDLSKLGGGFASAFKGLAASVAGQNKPQIADTSLVFNRPATQAPQSTSPEPQKNGLIRRFMPNPSLRITK